MSLVIETETLRKDEPGAVFDGTESYSVKVNGTDLVLVTHTPKEDETGKEIDDGFTMEWKGQVNFSELEKEVFEVLQYTIPISGSSKPVDVLRAATRAHFEFSPIDLKLVSPIDLFTFRS